MRRKLIGFSAALALVVSGVVLMMMHEARDFDSKRWQSQKGVTKDNERQGMLGTLERHLKPGMTRQEVERLLGPPDYRSPDRDSWELGRSPVGVSYETWVIEYDAEGRVVRFQLSRG